MSRAPAALIALLIALALQACGTKGPLYLPPPGATPGQADAKPSSAVR